MYWKKIGQLRNAPMNRAPVVTTLAAVLPIQRPAEAGDDRGASSGRKTIEELHAGFISRASG